MPLWAGCRGRRTVPDGMVLAESGLGEEAAAVNGCSLDLSRWRIEEDLTATRCRCIPEVVETGYSFDGFIITQSNVLNGSDQPIGASPASESANRSPSKSSSSVAMAAGLEEDDGAPKLVL
ncbi:hypothetical protein ACLOJK_034676 [Asimina triloba]